MKIKNLLIVSVLFLVMNGFSQNSVSEIQTKGNVVYITTSIEYPITGTYFLKGAEPVVELNSNGTGNYQLREQPKRAMIWGIECSEAGEPKFVKGFDNKEYSLYYKFTSALESESEEEWKKVEFSIHFNSMKMFINGERSKSFTASEEK